MPLEKNLVEESWNISSSGIVEVMRRFAIVEDGAIVQTYDHAATFVPQPQIPEDMPAAAASLCEILWTAEFVDNFLADVQSDVTA